MTEENNTLEQQVDKKNDQRLGVGIALATGVTIGVLCYGAFEVNKEAEVCYYGPVPIIEEQSENEEETMTDIEFDPKMEEVICDYGVPTTYWNK